jgi:hypothetical protein
MRVNVETVKPAFCSRSRLGIGESDLTLLGMFPGYFFFTASRPLNRLYFERLQ